MPAAGAGNYATIGTRISLARAATPPITWRRSREAFGFVVSAVRFRLADAADVAWRPADVVLGLRTLSNLFVWGPVTVVFFAIVHHDGRFGLVAGIQDPAALGA